MPSQRRVRSYIFALTLTILTLLYLSRSGPLTHTSDFTTRTQEALQTQEYASAARLRDADNVGSRLKAAEAAAKKAAEDKSAGFEAAVHGGAATGDEAKSVAGRVKLGAGAATEEKKEVVPGVAAHGGRPRDQAAKEGETDEEHSVEVELNAILKKSPSTSPSSLPSLPQRKLTTSTAIIFSKSYCPYSAKAKQILLQRYTITPTPYVVELDLHPLGPLLQRALAQMTGRSTVPNVLLLGKSLGGGDEMQALHEGGKLEERFRELGGSRIIEVKREGE